MKISSIGQLREIENFLRNYPEFIYSNEINSLKYEIPVFVFHTIEPEIFEAQLYFLVQNGYKTLSIKEYINIITKNDRLIPNSVLLTIDDARSSFWKYGFPLLKKFGLKATLFIIPGATYGENKRNNLFDVWENKISENQLLEIDRNDEQICTWGEIKEMYFSGLVDIESHTLYHKDVFVEKKILNFVNEKSNINPFNSSIAPYLTLDDLNKPIEKRNYIGLPLFKTDSLMKAVPHFNISLELKEMIREINKNLDIKTSFLVRKQIIYKRLINIDKYLVNVRNPQEELAIDLYQSKKIIQDNLGSNAGNNLCLPWTLGNQTTIRIAKELNYTSCFWGILEEKKTNKPGDDIFYNCRLKNDFIFRLPGSKRTSIFNIYLNKLNRRLTSRPIY